MNKNLFWESGNGQMSHMASQYLRFKILTLNAMVLRGSRVICTHMSGYLMTPDVYDLAHCRIDKLRPGDVIYGIAGLKLVISVQFDSVETCTIILTNSQVKNYNEFGFVTVWVIR